MGSREWLQGLRKAEATRIATRVVRAGGKLFGR
jgi:hypothetical protein